MSANFLQRMFSVISGQKASPAATAPTPPPVVNETPAWLEIRAVNRASVESGAHLEMERILSSNSLRTINRI